MAAFVAKQMMGSKLSAVKGAVSSDSGGGERDEEAERERLEAIREAEERRKEKHRKMEEEREKMRQDIRDKYNIPKRAADSQMSESFASDNSLNRKKKTPEELAAEAELDDTDDFTKLKNQLENHLMEIKSQIEARCSIQ